MDYVVFQDLSSHVTQGLADVNVLLEKGRSQRKKASTLMNPNSSRSHCIFTLTVECRELGADGEYHIRYSSKCHVTIILGHKIHRENFF